MKRFMVALAFGGAIFLFVQFDSLARGPGGGGRGGGGGARAGGGARTGGGGSRPSPAAGRSPALSGGSRSAARPNLGNSARPSGGNIGGPRPGAGNIGGARPGVGNIGGARPGAGNIGASRPIAGNISSARPNLGAGGRPNAGQLNNFLNAPTASTGAIGAGRGGAAANFLQGGNRPSQLPAGSGLAGGGLAGNRPSQLPSGPGTNRPAGGAGIGSGIAAGIGAGVGAGAGSAIGAGRGDRPGQLPSGPGSNRPGIGNGDRLGNIADNRPSRIENRQGRQDNRQQRRGEIGNQIRENNPRLDFWLDHPNWAQWRINAPYRWAAWGALTNWFGWGAYPEAAYGYGENVYYGEDQVYYGDQPVATADEYADQAAGIVATAPEHLDPQASDWMPLGVFALTQDNQATGPNPTLFFQLAVNKSAVISGTFKNTTTGETKTLEGAIDKSSQRAAWSVEGKSWPIMETGLSNLTSDTVPVLVHFDDGETQQFLLVRLDEPKT